MRREATSRARLFIRTSAFRPASRRRSPGLAGLALARESARKTAGSGDRRAATRMARPVFP